MTDDDRLDVVTERFERRLAEESGKTRGEIADVRGEIAEVRTEIADVRTEIADVRTEIAVGRTEVIGKIGELRAEMIHRNAELLKWMLGFFLTQTAAIAGLLALFL